MEISATERRKGQFPERPFRCPPRHVVVTISDETAKNGWKNALATAIFPACSEIKPTHPKGASTYRRSRGREGGGRDALTPCLPGPPRVSGGATGRRFWPPPGKAATSTGSPERTRRCLFNRLPVAGAERVSRYTGKRCQQPDGAGKRARKSFPGNARQQKAGAASMPRHRPWTCDRDKPNCLGPAGLGGKTLWRATRC